MSSNNVIRLDVVLDGSLQGLGVRTDDLANLLAVLEEEEGRHGADAELLRNFGNVVDIDLVETGVLVGVGHPVKRNNVVSRRLFPPQGLEKGKTYLTT